MRLAGQVCLRVYLLGRRSRYGRLSVVFRGVLGVPEGIEAYGLFRCVYFCGMLLSAFAALWPKSAVLWRRP